MSVRWTSSEETFASSELDNGLLVTLKSSGCSLSSLLVDNLRFRSSSLDLLDKSRGKSSVPSSLREIWSLGLLKTAFELGGGLAGDGVKCDEASSAVGGLIFADNDGNRGGVNLSLTGEVRSGLNDLNLFDMWCRLSALLSFGES